MELMCGASLAHHGLLGYLYDLTLCDVDLSPVPTQHLASLISSVDGFLHVDNASGCDMVSFLTSLKCTDLIISSQNLGRDETQALVQALESSVVTMELGGRATLDIEALAEYSGQGRCRRLRLQNTETKEKYRQELKTWARSKNWTYDDRGDLELNAIDLIDLTIE